MILFFFFFLVDVPLLLLLERLIEKTRGLLPYHFFYQPPLFFSSTFSPSSFSPLSSNIRMEEYNPEAPNDKVYKYTCRANDYFERQLYTEAIQDYSRAITAIAETDDTHFAALLHSNRSASYFKLKNWEQAEKDATETIRLEPTWAKVLKGLLRFSYAKMYSLH